jgi:arylformamidase
MKISLEIKSKRYMVDLSKPRDLSIPLEAGADTVNCFYAPLMEIAPVVMGDFIGDVEKGSPVNFKNVRLNPHGNGTHTECVGHIASPKFTINQCLKNFHFLAKLVSLYPIRQDNGDHLITKTQLEALFSPDQADAIIIRTLPNETAKMTRHYSGTNPPYLEPEAIEYLVACDVQHLLIDLPSVDREEDGGKVLGHRIFWQYPQTIEKERAGCTITELIFVDNAIKDGYFLLNLSIASFELDASPSKPIIYDLI